MELSSLSEKELLKLKSKQEQIVDTDRAKLIEQGYGHEIFSQMEKRAETDAEMFTKDACRNLYKLRDIAEECSKRRAYHGSLKPINNPSK